MLDVNKLENFFAVIRQYKADRDGEELSWTIVHFNEHLRENIEARGVKCEREGSELIIDLKSQEFSNSVLFFARNRFIKLFRWADMAKCVAIISDDCSFVIRDPSNAIQKSSFVSTDFALLCENTFAYFTLYENLKSEKFSQHHNEAQQDIVMYSSSRGIFRISYKGETPQFEEPISQRLDDLMTYALMAHYKPHIVHAIIDSSKSKVECHLKDVVSNSKLILENAIQGYDLAIRQFDFDKMRNSLHKEKDKFFANIRDITSKFFTQIVAIPLTASATALASFKVDGNVALNTAILFGLILFTILYLISQTSYYNDLSILKEDFDRDFSHIEKFSGISHVEIASERKKLDSKIESSRAIICFSIVASVVINALVSRYVIIQIMMEYLPPFISSRIEG